MTEVEELLVAGEQILEDPERASPMWLRAASLVLRSALEASLDAFWIRRSPGLQAANRRSQLACLPTWVGQDMAREVSNTWGELSTMGHHRSDLGPDPLALYRASQSVRQLTTRLGC